MVEDRSPIFVLHGVALHHVGVVVGVQMHVHFEPGRLPQAAKRGDIRRKNATRKTKQYEGVQIKWVLLYHASKNDLCCRIIEALIKIFRRHLCFFGRHFLAWLQYGAAEAQYFAGPQGSESRQVCRAARDAEGR
jgi:hypothetical protein